MYVRTSKRSPKAIKNEFLNSESVTGSPTMEKSCASVASFWQRMAFSSTGTMLRVLMEERAWLGGRSQRDEKSHPLSAPEAKFE